MNNPILKDNTKDVLSLLVFKQRFPFGSYEIYNAIIVGLDNPNRYEANKKHLIRALLQFDICYNYDYSISKLFEFLFKNNEYEILNHISKSNAIFIYTKMLEIKEKREWTEREEEFFQYVFECIITYYSKDIGKFALEAIKDGQINLFLKF